jgi:uncharacterized protein (TIGR03083 family)
MHPAGRIDVLDLFPEERRALLDVLSSLSDDEWRAPTVCAPWTVKDLAAHIVADDLGVISRGRDRYTASWIDASSLEALITAINAQNEAWVAATRRLSPRLIIELLEFGGERLAAHFRSLDLDAIGDPVSWTGPDPAPVWLDVAREYTEMWAHQQQIRDATGRPGLNDRRLFAPVLDAYVRALPYTFRMVAVHRRPHTAHRRNNPRSGNRLAPLHQRHHAARSTRPRVARRRSGASGPGVGDGVRARLGAWHKTTPNGNDMSYDH